MDDVVRKAITERMTVDILTAANALGISRNLGYLAAASGDIPIIRVGGRILVPTAPLRKMLGLEAA